jgi:hypothetical protein
MPAVENVPFRDESQVISNMHRLNHRGNHDERPDTRQERPVERRGLDKAQTAFELFGFAFHLDLDLNHDHE